MKIVSRAEYKHLQDRLTYLLQQSSKAEDRIERLESAIKSLQQFDESLTRIQIQDDYSYGDYLNLYGLRSVLDSLLSYLGLERVPPNRMGYRVAPMNQKDVGAPLKGKKK